MANIFKMTYSIAFQQLEYLNSTVGSGIWIRSTIKPYWLHRYFLPPIVAIGVPESEGLVGHLLKYSFGVAVPSFLVFQMTEKFTSTRIALAMLRQLLDHL